MEEGNIGWKGLRISGSPHSWVITQINLAHSQVRQSGRELWMQFLCFSANLNNKFLLNFVAVCMDSLFDDESY